MLIKPNIANKEITHCLQNAYGLNIETVSFLPLGADLNTAVYRVATSNLTNYFLKLRRGEFNEAAVLVPKYLADRGIKNVIPPLTTKTGQLWTNLAPFTVTLYPYIEGHNGFDVALSDQQWIDFGATIKQLRNIRKPINNKSTILSFLPPSRNPGLFF